LVAADVLHEQVQEPSQSQQADVVQFRPYLLGEDVQALLEHGLVSVEGEVVGRQFLKTLKQTSPHLGQAAALELLAEEGNELEGLLLICQ
jgi:hypothetical protein